MPTATVRCRRATLPFLGVLLVIALLILSRPLQAQPQRLEAGGQVTLFQFDLVQGSSVVNQKLWLGGGFLQVNMAPSLAFRLGGLFGGGSIMLLQLDTEILARYNVGQADLYLGGGVGFIQMSSAGGVFSFQIPLFGVIGLETSHQDSGLNGFVDFRPVLPMNLGNSLLQLGTGQPPFQFSFGFLYRL